jgi:hypothetical protein
MVAGPGTPPGPATISTADPARPTLPARAVGLCGMSLPAARRARQKRSAPRLQGDEDG